ncbi:MAG: hypothetical protein PHI45_00795 [Candidatus Pacebacteria bacterium]|nr:hypothetical protein [Candidatus Paceibacterota bacterium]MDD5012986.1 hypothetical protein [Candidatus Paceibacterota bacterium]MDD5752614.1 hypothetical protein [Candidatus Paceibacterota bacterium]
MNKLFIVIILMLFVGFSCYASDGFIDSFINKIMYLKDWFMNGEFKQEFNKELEEIKAEIPGLIAKAKELLPQK